ncbi:ABC transporter permease [Spirosoma foliorum]|uniref:ABC transporter permease n=1 Tax=Spirosoma foliorum TaxID=2710596 RepID=A0A7G5H311_9BACT|nr:ABC transporter permease [Spirosoma foliorum]QMW05503.1 ABC transporter permease [Spirosoma foliorum]
MQPEKPTFGEPPKWITWVIERLCAPHLREEVLGDLHERYALQVAQWGETKARRRYWREVVAYMRPSILARETSEYSTPTNTDMLRNYLKIAFRTLVKNKGYSFINIGGLAVGMAVAMLIGLWIYDELSYEKSFPNYDRIAQVMQHQTANGEVFTGPSIPIPLANELRTTYGYDRTGGPFKYILLSSWTEGHTLSFGEKKLWKTGNYIEPEAPEMLSLTMRRGTRAALREPYSIMINESVATALFGSGNPMGKIIKIDNQIAVKVAGVYADLPYNTRFSNLDYLVPWQVNVAVRDWVKNSQEKWDNNSFQIFVQLAEHADMAAVSAKIKDAKQRHINASLANSKPEIFLQAMSRWHLYSEFKDGVNTGGRIQFVWLFGIIGAFVLLLACINFMNLSTARSEKRAKEVGIRKAIGSVRSQLISQFFSESFLVVYLAFCIALLLSQFALPFFNEVAEKQMTFPWAVSEFWLCSIGFTLFTGLVAGSYPALYLSSFQSVKILKGTFKVGRFAAVPRQVLVVVQFTVSVALIIGTIIVFRQIQFAKDRPIGYSRNGLLYVQTTTPDIHNHLDAFRNDLLASGAVTEIAESESPLTGVWNVNSGFDWDGKAPDQSPDFAVVGVSHGFGKTVGWQFKEGRDFSKNFGTDSMGMVLNEAAVKFMGLKDPIGKTIREGDLRYKIIGVIDDMVMESPYEPARQTLFYLGNFASNFINIRISPGISASEAVSKIGAVFQKYDPASPFNYKFADQEYARKFAAEENIGTLASFFATLAIFISCLGLFGLASFVAEQRTKEIGVRKVLGASVFSLWGLLSKDFVLLVIIAFGIATPIAWYYLDSWLQKYEYRTELSWWVFAASGAGALLVTLLTVSFQSVKAALMDPVKSLRSE